MNAKTYSFSVAKMIAGSKSKKGVKHVAIPSEVEGQYLVVAEEPTEILVAVEAEESVQKAEAEVPDAPVVVEAQKATRRKGKVMLAATLPLITSDVSEDRLWFGAETPNGTVTWFHKSCVTAIDMDAKLITVLVPEAKARVKSRASIEWADVAN